MPYPGNNFPSITSQSLGGQVLAVPIASKPTLGGRSPAGTPIEFLNIVEPGTLYDDRLNQIDLRFGKNLRYGRTKTLVALDVFNLFNSNTPDVYQRELLARADLDVSQPAVDHGRALLQDQRAVRLLR